MRSIVKVCLAVVAVSSAFAVACGEEPSKPPYVDTANPDADSGKADSRTTHTTLESTVDFGGEVRGSFISKGYAGYTVVAKAGDTLNVTLDSDDADPVAIVYGPQHKSGAWGNKIALNDDASADTLGSHLAVNVTQDGTYLVLAAEYSRGTGDYRLKLAARANGPLDACTTDSDCVTVEADCCKTHCGQFVAVNASSTEAFEATLHCAANMICPQIRCGKPTPAAACVANKCVTATTAPTP